MNHSYKTQSFKPLYHALLIIAALTMTAGTQAREHGSGGKYKSRGPAMSGSISGRPGQYGASSHSGKHYDKHYEDRQDRYEERKDRYEQRYDDRNDRYEQRYEDRKEFYEQRHEDRKELIEDHQEWHEDRWHAAVGATLTINAFNAMACRHTIVHIKGVTYYHCGNNWYTRGYRSGSVVFIVAPRPHGY